jgi:hypothetical protein
MVRNIGHELVEIEQDIIRCRGDHNVEPKLTGALMAHLLISSRPQAGMPTPDSGSNARG